MQISELFLRHPCLFSRVVRDPDNLRALFAWLRSLGLDQAAVLRMLDRLPLLLQMDVEAGGWMGGWVGAGGSFFLHLCG